MKKNYDHIAVTECSTGIEVRGQMTKNGGIAFWAPLTPQEAFELWHLLGQTNLVRGYERMVVRKALYGRKA